MLKTVLLDLDGTLYCGNSEVPGAVDFVNRCRQTGLRCLFVTNRSNRRPEIIRDQLRGYGIPCETEDIITSALATAMYIGHGSTYMIGEDGLESALREHGIHLTDQSPDTVVVSYDRQFSYDKLTTACRLICAGARFVATNPDCRLRMNGETLPGTGAIVAAVATGCGIAPEMVGKPHRRIFDLALRKVGCRPEEALAIGDNIDTDIGAARAAGISSVLLLTGVTRREDLVEGKPVPDHVAEHFDEVWRWMNP